MRNRSSSGGSVDSIPTNAVDQNKQNGRRKRQQHRLTALSDGALNTGESSARVRLINGVFLLIYMCVFRKSLRARLQLFSVQNFPKSTGNILNE